jgi:hypothetical protein
MRFDLRDRTPHRLAAAIHRPEAGQTAQGQAGIADDGLTRRSD